MGKWYQGRHGALFFLLLGLGLVLVYAALEWRFPAAERLESVTGRVEWTYDSQDAQYLALGGDAGQYVVHVKGDADGRMRAALRAATGLYPVTLRFDRGQVNRPGIRPGAFYTVYAVSVGGKQVTSLEAVHASHRRDNLTALGLGLAFLALGAFSWWRS